MQLTSSTAIITGAASGMGEATARLLAKQGVKVALLDRDLEKAKIIAEQIGGLALLCDVTRDEQIEHAVNEAVAWFGAPRICVNCAGIAPSKRVVGRSGLMPLQEFRDVIEINLIGSFNVMRHVSAHMVSAPLLGEERGVIINTASVAAYEGQIGQTAYSASKGGIVSMTLPAAREFAQFAVRVNTIAPGIIATPMMQSMPQNVQDSLVASVPFPKRFGAPEEYASLVQHIIENAMLNGTVIRLDGAIRMA